MCVLSRLLEHEEACEMESQIQPTLIIYINNT